MKNPYDDILYLPHHVSPTRPQMSIENRAAQFAPFAALTGYEAVIKETARVTTKAVELDENTITVLDKKLRILAESGMTQPEISVSFFQADKRKDGGIYITITGNLKRIDTVERSLIMMDGRMIPIKDIHDMDSALFDFFE